MRAENAPELRNSPQSRTRNGQSANMDLAAHKTRTRIGREAVKWFQRAADQGNAIAQSILAASYANGEGAEKNFVEAYKWYNLASAQGNISATTARDNLAASMTPDQIAEAQRLSSEFQPHKESASTNSN